MTIGYETELPVEAIPEVHQRNLQILWAMESPDVIGLLRTIDYTSKQSTIPTILFPHLRNVSPMALKEAFSEYQWVLKEALLIRKWMGQLVQDRLFHAALLGHVSCFFYALQKGWGTLDVRLFQCAIQGGNQQIMNYLLERQCPWDDTVFLTGVKTQSIPLLEWLVRNQCPWDNKSIQYAIQVNNLPLLQWLYAKGCPKENPFIMMHALHVGSLEILRFLVQEKGHVVFSHHWFLAIRRGDTEILDWMKEQPIPFFFSPNLYFNEAVKTGKLEVVQWCHTHLGRIHPTMAPCHWAAREGNWDVLKWLKESLFFPWQKKRCVELARKRAQPEMVAWIQNYKKRRPVQRKRKAVNVAV